jgi:digeranylgeranylglycerophospholipid reductase
MAAKTAAESGAEVLLIEEDWEIGVPVVCAEGVSAESLVDYLGIDPRWVAAEIDGALFVSPGGGQVCVDYPGAGYILERRVFDRDLAALAAGAGAGLEVGLKAVGLESAGDGRHKVYVKRGSRRWSVEARIVIGADGFGSRIGRWAGLDTKLAPGDIHACAQYLLACTDADAHRVEFTLGNDIAPGGYVWVFPKGNGKANVGVGIWPPVAKQSVLEYAERYIESRFPAAVRLERTVGAVSAVLPGRIVGNGVILVGDAARVTDPISGAGIGNAIASGTMAGRIASEALREGDVSARRLSAYEEEWERAIGKQMRLHARIREVFLKLTDGDFEILVEIGNRLVEERDVRKIDLYDILRVIITGNPRFLKIARHLLP